MTVYQSLIGLGCSKLSFANNTKLHNLVSNEKPIFIDLRVILIDNMLMIWYSVKVSTKNLLSTI